MVNLPSTFSELPRATLLYDHPSPIEHLKRLSIALAQPNADEETKFWIKREDSNSGLAYGGNKIRKLEYVLPDALSQGATVLVTTGGLQSNHMRQVAAAGARYGLKVIAYPAAGISEVKYLIDTSRTTRQSEARRRRVQVFGQYPDYPSAGSRP
jgi:1-aminocyclopropane-1-carboxylate deaminase